jgi:hypothetical protein
MARGFSSAELALLREHGAAQTERVAAAHREVVDLVGRRSRALLAKRMSLVASFLEAHGASTYELGWLRRVLEAPDRHFQWHLATVEDRTTFHLGDGYGLAVDVLEFLQRVEGKWPRGLQARVPMDLVEELVLRMAIVRLRLLDDRSLERLISRTFGRAPPSARRAAVLKSVLSAFVHWRVATSQGWEVLDEDDALEHAFARASAPLPARAIGLGIAAALTLGLTLAWATWVGGSEAVAGLRRLDARLWVGLLTGVIVVGVGIAMESRAALLVASLLGVPLELPFRVLSDDTTVCRRRARRLARFLSETPRGYNTPGAHVAYGVIAVKRSLKSLCLRRERQDDALADLVDRRTEAVALRTALHERVIAGWGKDPELAARWSQVEHALSREVGALDARIRQRRLRIQAEVVALFRREWDEVRDVARAAPDAYARVAAEFRPSGEGAMALLPAGLLRSRLTTFFEYSMFLSRVMVALLFLGTLHVSYLPWAAALLLLQLYVVEPVVANIHIHALDLLVDHPGHSLVDLKAHLEEKLPAGEVFRVPVVVPKFSSNPARAGLSSIVRAAWRRCGIEPDRVVPFAMRDGNRDTVIHLRAEAGDAMAHRRAEALRDAIAAELASARPQFPLATEVHAHDDRVVVSLVDPDDKIWDLIGEDADQAHLYMRRSLEGLRDTLDHLGPTFAPAFFLVSNTRDPDVIHYEMQSIRALQTISDREYRGRVGFLYLLHRGAWLDYAGADLPFDASDEAVGHALAHWRAAAPAGGDPRQAYVARALAGVDSAAQLARALNRILDDPAFPSLFDRAYCGSLPPHLRPSDETLALLTRYHASSALSRSERRRLNRDLLLTILPMRHSGGFFKKVGNDIAVHELLVLGKTRPACYTDRRSSEWVRDPEAPNFSRVWGNFERYTDIAGSNESIQRAILAGWDVDVGEVPSVAAVIDDKNEFAPGEVEKALAIMLHPANRHIVIGVPQVEVTLPRHHSGTIASEYIKTVRSARRVHNATSARGRARLFESSSPAYGKWWLRPEPYVSHYTQEVLNAAHALSHDFQQSYFVTGAAGRLAAFAEALCGPSRFRLRPLEGGSRRGNSAPE